MIPVTKAYVFESDNEAHINSNELSDLSDIFEDTAELTLDEYHRRSKTDRKETSLALDEISYDRDLKNVNVPNNSRQKPTLFDPGNRVIKQVSAITSSTTKEFKVSDDKKKDGDKSSAKAGGNKTDNNKASTAKGGQQQGKLQGGDQLGNNASQRKSDDTNLEFEDGKDGMKSGVKGRYRQQKDGPSSNNNNLGTFSKDSADHRPSSRGEGSYQRRGGNRDTGKSKHKHSEYGYYGSEYDINGNPVDTAQYPFNGMEETDVYGGMPPPIYGNFIPPMNYYGSYYAHPTQPFEAPILPPLPTIPPSGSAPTPLPLPVVPPIPPLPTALTSSPPPLPTLNASVGNNTAHINEQSSSTPANQAEADAAAAQSSQVLNPFAQAFVPSSYMLR